MGGAVCSSTDRMTDHHSDWLAEHALGEADAGVAQEQTGQVALRELALVGGRDSRGGTSHPLKHVITAGRHSHHLDCETELPREELLLGKGLGESRYAERSRAVVGLNYLNPERS